MSDRVFKQTIVDGNATSRKYIVDIAGRLPTILIEIDPNDVNDPNDDSLENSYLYTPGGQILAQFDCNGIDDNNEVVIEGRYFYIHDRLGSVRLLINSVGSVVNSYTYSPFGETFATEVNETVYNPFLFTGQWFGNN